jgi:hypothetical protein
MAQVHEVLQKMPSRAESASGSEYYLTRFHSSDSSLFISSGELHSITYSNLQLHPNRINGCKFFIRLEMDLMCSFHRTWIIIVGGFKTKSWHRA